MPTLTRLAPLLAAGAALLACAQPAAAAKSCTRGGAKLEQSGGGVRVVRVSARRESRQETRHENLLACWTKSGRRTVIAQEVDFGDDNIARTNVEIVQGRYVGVREENEGGVSLGVQARMFDARSGKLLHDSGECDKVNQGDFGGVLDVAFLDKGGLAMACNELLLYRNATAPLETLEPAGTNVLQIGVSHYSYGFGQRLFWTISTPGGEVTKSLTL